MPKISTTPQPIEKILQTIERQLHDLNRIERERLAAGLSLTKGFKKALSKELAGHDKDLSATVMEALK